MSEARGDVIAFLDADDLWSPDYLATIASVYQDFPSTDAVCSNSWDQYSDGYHLNVSPVKEGVVLVDDFFLAWLRKDIVLRTSGVTVRRSFIERVGPMRADLIRAQDYEYWSRLGAAGANWAFSSRPHILYDGVRVESLSRNTRRFADAPLPETWSRDVWPLLDGERIESFRRFYIKWSAMWCWHELQTGLDHQAKTTAQEALARARGCREVAFLLAVQHIPGWVHRLVWQAGSPVKRTLRYSIKRLRPKRARSEGLKPTWLTPFVASHVILSASSPGSPRTRPQWPFDQSE